jgi:hypothetical protein
LLYIINPYLIAKITFKKFPDLILALFEHSVKIKMTTNTNLYKPACRQAGLQIFNLFFSPTTMDIGAGENENERGIIPSLARRGAPMDIGAASPERSRRGWY